MSITNAILDKIAITFLGKNKYISRSFSYVIVRPKTSDKLSVNIDHVYCLFIYLENKVPTVESTCIPRKLGTYYLYIYLEN